MAVKKGYKQTEIGVIPEDWDVVLLGRLVRSVEYGSSAKSNTEGGVPVLRMGNLQNGKIDWDDLVYTLNENEISKYMLRPNDVLFNRTNTIELVGKTAIYRAERPAIFAGYLIRIKVLQNLLDSRYLNYTLNTSLARKHSAKILSVAVGQANINGQKLKTYPIPLPPTLAEQEAIAGALSDADAWIESLEQLIAKKRQIKQGAMQELLTGKRRLPGFEVKRGYKQTEVGVIPNDWNTIRLTLLADVRDGTHESPRYVKDGVPFVTSKNIVSGRIDFKEITYISEPDAREIDKRSKVNRNDILVSMIGTVGNAAIIDFDPVFCIKNVALIKTDINALHPYYLLQLIRSDDYSSYIESQLAGGIQKFISLSILRSLDVPLPPIFTEQTAIATVLSDMDTEIESLESKLAKAREIKQGMMQELLTGRIRLIEN
jgi:type I restriction enzyme S subunit